MATTFNVVKHDEEGGEANRRKILFLVERASDAAYRIVRNVQRQARDWLTLDEDGIRTVTPRREDDYDDSIHPRRRLRPKRSRTSGKRTPSARPVIILDDDEE